MYCYNCGKKVDEKAAVCVGCGVLLKSKHFGEKKGRGIASMILGILSVLFALVILLELPAYEDLSYELEDYTISLKMVYAATYTLYINILSITGICLACSERRINNNGFNTAGFWLTLTSLIISGFISLYIVFC